MEIKHIRELIKLMKDNDITEIKINEGETKLYLKRGIGEGTTQIIRQPAVLSPSQVIQPQVTPQNTLPTPPEPSTQPSTPTETSKEEGLITINSPLVGTFYAAPAPDAEPYVKVGDKVTPETVVCIVEAMKVMNEIKAEVSGTIVEVLVENAQPVEFDQPLFKVKPD